MASHPHPKPHNGRNHSRRDTIRQTSFTALERGASGAGRHERASSAVRRERAPCSGQHDRASSAGRCDEGEGRRRDLVRLRQYLISLRNRLSRAEEDADCAVQLLEALIGESVAPVRASPGGKLLQLQQFKDQDAAACRQVAESGTSEFHVTRNSDGSVTAKITNQKVHLSRTLGELLIAIASDVRGNDGDIVVWKSYEQIARILEQRLGRKMRTGTIRQSISRLRSALATAGINRFFVQTRPVLQVRFALRRRRRTAAWNDRKATRYPRNEARARRLVEGRSRRKAPGRRRPYVTPVLSRPTALSGLQARGRGL